MVRRVNQIGSAEIIVPRKSELRLGFRLERDMILELWRHDPVYGSSFLLGNTALFIRKKKVTNDKIHLTCVDNIDLLRRRVVPYKSGESQTKVNAPGDDAIKKVVRENLSSLATDVNRQIPSSFFYVEDDEGHGYTVDRSFAWGNVLYICQEIAEESTERGTYLAFDVESPYGGGFPLKLRTYTGQRGLDRRLSTITGYNVSFSEEAGTFENVTFTEDHTDERTVVYAGGQGQEASRYLATAVDSQLSTTGPFTRIEEFHNASAISQASKVDAEALWQLRQSRPRVTLEADIVEMEGNAFGVNWGYGDYVTATFNNRFFDCRNDGIEITVTPDGGESFRALFRSEKEWQSEFYEPWLLK
jgi:hypothetical protein